MAAGSCNLFGDGARVPYYLCEPCRDRWAGGVQRLLDSWIADANTPDNTALEELAAWDRQHIG